MEFGSVRFFKRLFLLILALMILVPTVTSIVLGVSNHGRKVQVRALEARVETLEGELAARPSEPAAPSASPEPSYAPGETEQPAWQGLYPELHAVTQARSTVNEEKTVYLTFEDGPSERTEEILAILEREDIQATFFLKGGEGEAWEGWVRDIAAAGHSLGLHSYSHDYQEIYASVEAYLADCEKQLLRIREVTGETVELLRFPGGSVNTYNAGIYQELIGEMTRRGFVYFDWNVSGADAAMGGAEAEQIAENALAGIGQRRVILQLHDSAGKATTVEALEEIIRGYREAGYTFAPLTAAVTPVAFGYIE